MIPIRSVGTRLSLALLIVLAGALGIVYLIVVPSLEKRLIHTRLVQLERAAPSLAHELLTVQFPIQQDFTETAAGSANARVVVFDILTNPPNTTLRVVADSHGLVSTDVENDPIALHAADTLRRQHGTVERVGGRFAEVADPVTLRGPVLLLSAPLQNALGAVHLVQRRLLAAGLVALVVSLVIGYGGASVFARRIRRLEQAAERIAGGQFDEPVADLGADEVGQLAGAFERMRQQLAQLDHARREFVANASHELRTPIFSLGGFLELLTDEDLDEATRREFLETMREQVDRLTKLTAELLDLSRLDSGRMRIDREALDLAELAHSLVNEFRALARARGHLLEVDAGGEATALADEERVLQIGRIVVDNALAHTPPGTRVRVHAESDGTRALLVVEDEGQGIPDEHAVHIFERFYRIDGTIAYGSGLGLAIARELAELMDGRIELDSEPGRTVFTLVLPATAARVAEPRPQPSEPVTI